MRKRSRKGKGEGERASRRRAKRNKRKNEPNFLYLFHSDALARDFVPRRGDDPVRALADGLEVGVRRKRKQRLNQ